MEKDETTWWRKCTAKQRSQIPSRNIIKFTPGLKGPALNVNSTADFCGLFVTPEIIGSFVEDTDSIIATKERKVCSVEQNKGHCLEMKALIGLLMLAGTCHASRLHLADIWKPGGTGIQVIRLAMSLHRLHLLLCCQ